MGTNYNPKIVTDGLILYLDAGNPNSYSYLNQDTEFIDLALSRNYVFKDKNLNVVDSKLYYLSNPSRFSLSLFCGYVGNSFIDIKTVAVFNKTKSINYTWLEGQDDTYFLSNYDGKSYTHGNCGAGVVNFVDLIEVNLDTPPIDDMWHMLEAKNVQFDPSWDRFKWFLRDVDYVIENAIVMGYNKVLSPEESAQNFKALKGRFGI